MRPIMTPAILRLTLSSSALALSVLPASAIAQDVAADETETMDSGITADGVRAHIEFLADDLLQGRDPGTPGYDIAARYVASQFVAMGVEPAMQDGSWYQPVPLRQTTGEGDFGLKLTVNGEDLALNKSDDYIVRGGANSGARSVSAPLVFVGYGFDRPDLGFDDYAGLDVEGKIVVSLTGFPKGMPSELGAHLSATKSAMADKRGAIGSITIPTYQYIERRPWAQLKEFASSPSMGWVNADGATHSLAPGIALGAIMHPDAAAALFADADTDLQPILALADTDGGRPKGFALDAQAELSASDAARDFPSPNVIGMIRGSDPELADEYVLMTAHLDHVGVHGPDDAEDRIHNGAMDNAAGVATMLEVARAIVSSGARPRRPILFAAVTAEEGGLLGSDYLSRNPVRDDGEVVAVVNFDMPVLTYAFSDVIAFGAEHSSLGPMVDKAANSVGVALSPDPIPEEGIFTRSDHYRFVQQGIPSVFLATGFAGDGAETFTSFLATHYHKPSDDLNLPIDWDAGARFAEVNYRIVSGIANADERPRWNEGDFFGDEFAPDQPRAPAP